jgi:hypothetical protein
MIMSKKNNKSSKRLNYNYYKSLKDSIPEPNSSEYYETLKIIQKKLDIDHTIDENTLDLNQNSDHVHAYGDFKRSTSINVSYNNISFENINYDNIDNNNKEYYANLNNCEALTYSKLEEKDLENGNHIN